MLRQTVPIPQHSLAKELAPYIQSTTRHREFHGVTSQCILILCQCEKVPVVKLFYIVQYLVCFDQVTTSSSFLECSEFQRLKSFFIWLVPQSLDHFSCSVLNFLQAVYIRFEIRVVLL